jgi:hypothetical protein
MPTYSNKWKLQHPDAPRQRDAGGSTGVNCGVHVCATGERLINRLPVDFTGTEIDDKYRHIIGKRLLTALKARRALTTRARPAAVNEHADTSIGDHMAEADSEHAAADVGPHTAAANGDRAAVAVVDHTAAANGERAVAAYNEYTIEGRG